MNKKTLILSIIAVAVLIGVSFTSVVGYRSGGNYLQIPRRKSKTSIINIFIDIINKMDDSTYNIFVRRVITRCNVDNSDINEIL